MVSTNTPASSALWIQDSQAFMHDQFQAVKDHYIAASRESEQRLQVYFSVLAALIAATVYLLDKNYTWAIIPLPWVLLSFGIYTFKSVNAFTWFRVGLAAELDFWTMRWTCHRKPNECFLLLRHLWYKLEAEKDQTISVPKTRKDKIKYTISFYFRRKEYINFVVEMPHAAFIAAINSICGYYIALQFLSSSFLQQYAEWVGLFLGLFFWCSHVVHYRSGIVWIEALLSERLCGVKAEIQSQVKPLEDNDGETATTSPRLTSEKSKPEATPST